MTDREPTSGEAVPGPQAGPGEESPAGHDPARTLVMKHRAASLRSGPASVLPRWRILGSASTGPPPGGEAPAYLLERLAGQGGFGDVWQALQVSLGRSVALKRLRPETEGDPISRQEGLELFRQEALTTALLEHPSVVPVYDLGADERGDPALAMRFVDGVLWSDVLARDFRELDADEYLARHLPILKGVVQAIAFAHSRGVVHRDVKPGQVMIGAYGEVLLLDWGLAIHVGGVAGATPADDLGLPTPRTATNPAGTPAYMAPEQTDRSASRIGPHTDIYLLGGTLYTVLTGALPHPAEGTSLALRQAAEGFVAPVWEAAPSRPVPPELALLAMRCLAPRIEERPGSARDMVEALDDFLSGAGHRRESLAITEKAAARLRTGLGDYRAHADLLAEVARARQLWPGNPEADGLFLDASESFARSALAAGDLVLARIEAEALPEGEPRGSLLAEIDHRERQTARISRQRRLAIRATWLLLLLVAVSSSFYAVALRRARDRAEAARQGETLARGRSEELLGFLLHDLRDELEGTGRLPVLEKVALKAIEEIRKIPSSQLSDAALAQRARAFDLLGDVLERQGSLPAAENALRESLQVREGLAAGDPASAERKHDVAISHGNLSRVRHAEGDTPAALGHARLSFALLREALAAPDAPPAWRKDLSSAHLRLGDILSETGDAAGALKEQRAAVAILQELLGARPADPILRRDVAVARSKVGDVLQARGDLDGAFQEYRAYRDALAGLAAQDPGNADFQRELAVGHNSVGWALRAKGDLDGALAEFRAQREIGLRLRKADPDNVLLRRDVAQATAVIGRVLLAGGDSTRALAELRGASDELSRIAAADASNAAARRDAAVAATLVGEVLVGRRDPAAEGVLSAASAELRKLAASDPANVEWTIDLAVTELWHARALLGTGASEAGRAELVRAADRLSPLTATLDAADARAVSTRALLLFLLGRDAEALPLAGRAIAAGAASPELRKLAGAAAAPRPKR